MRTKRKKLSPNQKNQKRIALLKAVGSAPKKTAAQIRNEATAELKKLRRNKSVALTLNIAD